MIAISSDEKNDSDNSACMIVPPTCIDVGVNSNEKLLSPKLRKTYKKVEKKTIKKVKG